jgi:hypothetical protein
MKQKNINADDTKRMIDAKIQEIEYNTIAHKEYVARLETKASANNFGLKLCCMICATVLGFLTLIGVFWGREGYINLGLGILGAVAFILVVAMAMQGNN